jgi:cytochrome c
MDRLLNRGVHAAGLLALCAVFAAGPCSAADAVHGKTVFNQQCGVCHSAAKGGPNTVGPDLYGVVGRAAGSLKGFNYSSAMKSANFSWSVDRLHDYIASPVSVVPGNHMPYSGLKNSAQLDDLLAYLKSLD